MKRDFLNVYWSEVRVVEENEAHVLYPLHL